MIAVRQGDPGVAFESYDIDRPYSRSEFSAVDDLPEHWTAIKKPVTEEPPSEEGCFKHLQDLRALCTALDLPWWDQAHPDRAGVFVAGSFATPCYEGFDKHSVSTHRFDKDGLAVVTEHVMHMPRGRSDIDLFMAGADERSALGVISSFMWSWEAHPLSALDAIKECVKCQAHTRASTLCQHKQCPQCSIYNMRSTLVMYTGKHVMCFKFGCLKFELVTRLYATPWRCPALFDLTYDGFLFFGGDRVHALDMATYQVAARVLIPTVFSGSSTQEVRHIKKLLTYNLDLVVPGLKWGTCTDNERGLTVVRDCLLYMRGVVLPQKAFATLSTQTAMAAVRDMRLPLHLARLFRAAASKNVRNPSGIVGMFVSPADRDTYSFVTGCRGVRLPGILRNDRPLKGTILLMDVPGTTEHVGAFCFRKPIDFAADSCMDLVIQEDAPATHVTVAQTQTARRMSKAFHLRLRPLIVAFTLDAVTDAVTHVQLEQLEGATLRVRLRFQLFGQPALQTWTVAFGDVIGPPVLRCTSKTGLYATGEPVCMGTMSHFHVEGAPMFSLAALITCFVERPYKILDGDEEHLVSVGVLEKVASQDDVVLLHGEACSEWDDECPCTFVR